jgi:ActR/RegA family two-component response regulator
VDDDPRDEPLRCVLLADPRVRPLRDLEAAIARSGAELVGTAETWPALLAQVVHRRADAAVLDLALAGSAGVRLIAAVRVLVPDCEVLLLSELRGIDLPAIEAGAHRIVDPSDLRPLTAALVGLAGGRVNGGVGPYR